ncbi:MAG TPA: CPBP family intramembrane glutamic endopeptidase [Ktedonobacteraceae bacterium]|nr:CPBP family intramembrane glutamic endopeptidase [Ktedonobacteraceae bacterium]
MSTTATTSLPAVSSPLKRLIMRHPLIAFFVIAFAGTWIAFLPLVLGQNGLGLFPYTIPEIGPWPPSYLFAALGALLGPTLASFTVTAITTGKAGMQHLLRRYVIWRVGLRWYLLVLVGVPVFQLVCASVFLGIAPLTALIQQWPLYFTTFLPNVLIITVAVQIWEEGGWSGYAVPNLQKRFGAVRTALILGPLWALWHLPAFFVPGQIFDQKVGAITMIVQMVLMIIVAILTRIFMIWVFNNTKGSILIAILLHASLDASNSGSAFITHLLTASQLGSYGLASALLFPLVAAVLLLVFTRGRLSYKPNRTRQDVEASQSEGVVSSKV